jgi:hypothetical protein
MKKLNFLYPVIIITISILLTSSCILKKKSATEITRIVYHYGDSSVPPQYHRSYQITATYDSLRIIVDSYGTVLADKVFDFDGDKFATLIDQIEKSKLKNGKKTTDNKGCTGGTSKSISVFEGEKVILNGTNYYCGGQEFGDLKGDAESFAVTIKAFIPDLDILLK